MQKKLIALAVAGLASTAAFAQSNVTVYGVADVTFDVAKASNATVVGGATREQFNRVSSNSSLIGFKGAEDLGNGLKAVFQIETGVTMDGTTGNTFGVTRDSFVGVAGGFGTVVGGLLTGPTRALGARMDLNSGATGPGANSSIIGKPLGGAGAGALDTRLQNTVAYVSPSFSGFNAVVGYSAGPTGAENRNSSPVTAANQEIRTTAWDLGLNYTNGPIDVGYAYAKVDFGTQDSATVAGNLAAGTAANVAGFVTVAGAPFAVATIANEWTNHRLAGAFTFGGGHKVVALWDQAKVNAAAGLEVKRTTWGVGGKFMVTPAGGLIAQYYKANDAKLSGAAAGASGSDTGARLWEVGYEHALSKRTVAKASYTQLKNESSATYDFNIGSVGGFGVGADPRVIQVGVRHSF